MGIGLGLVGGLPVKDLSFEERVHSCSTWKFTIRLNSSCHTFSP